MKCPLLAHKTYIEDDWPTQVYEDCLKQECAWWYKENGSCALLTLAQGSTYLHKVLLDMEKKMPHEKQFRRF